MQLYGVSSSAGERTGLPRATIFDADIRGFAVCIYRAGGQAFNFDYRVDDRQRRMTIAR